MTKITFTLDGREVEAKDGETIWQVAQRAGTTIPHLCWHPAPGYRADGNCRACMVEVEGERVLAASCQRKPSQGMKVKTGSERAKKSREMVFELLASDQPQREESHDPKSKFWNWIDAMGVQPTSRFGHGERPAADNTHTAISVNLDACINCGLCVRACREVQMNDVIGMAYRGAGAKVVFDFDKGMGESTCVACGECVQVCPTGALMEGNLLDRSTGKRVAFEDKTVDTLCPYCGVGCQTSVHVKDNKILYVDGRDGPANENRLCVKGRFGFDYIHHPDRLTKPLIRRDGVAKDANIQIKRDEMGKYFREATWEEALDLAANGLKKVHAAKGPVRHRRLRLGERLQRGGLPLPEADPPGLRHQQRRPLHAAVPRIVGRSADGGPQLRRCHRAVHGGEGQRLHHRDRRAPRREPSRSPPRSSRTRPSAARS